MYICTSVFVSFETSPTRPIFNTYDILVSTVGVNVMVTCDVLGTLNHYKIDLVKNNFELCALRRDTDVKTFLLSLTP